jgi:hypothetical protein
MSSGILLGTHPSFGSQGSRTNSCLRILKERKFHRPDMTKGVRKNITVPGLLAPPSPTDAGVRPQNGFTVCGGFGLLDLRAGAAHTITLAISQDSQAAQDAVDAELAARYRPGQSREGLLVELVERLPRFGT